MTQLEGPQRDKDMGDIALPERWTRVYFKNGDFLDYDANAAEILVDAILEGHKVCTILTSYGETHYIVVSEIQSISKRNLEGLKHIWRESNAWEELRRSIEGWKDNE